MDKFNILSKNKINQLPKTSGVYSFWSKKNLVYIGKAMNVRDRVKSHFNQPSYRDDLFINKITKIGFFETNSEIEALISEANLIKKYQPKFNVIWRDDKNYFYVAIAENKDKIPYVFITHQPHHSSLRAGRSNLNYRLLRPATLRSRLKATRNDFFIGPFTDGTALKKTLRFLRRVFPHYTAKKHPKNKCTYCHLDLCPGPNPDLGEYKKNIKKLILILKGKRGAVLKSLKKEMRAAVKEQNFEKAGKIRDKIFSLQQVMAHTHVINSGAKMAENFAQAKFSAAWIKAQRILQVILNFKKPISIIECYDVSNIQGKQATGSMVVFVNGKPDKNLYRKFRIRMENEPNDTAMIKEVLERRLKHPEWKYPDLILIDGGRAQLNAALKIKNLKLKIHPVKYRGAVISPEAKLFNRVKVLAIAKRNNELFIEGKDKPVLLKTLPREIFNLILQLRDEAHRFAIAYHKKLRKNYLLK